jgi:hypothetical protein
MTAIISPGLPPIAALTLAGGPLSETLEQGQASFQPSNTRSDFLMMMRGTAGRGDPIPHHIEVLHHRDPEVRRAAVEVLGKDVVAWPDRKEEIINVLQDHLGHEVDRKVRESIRKVLGSLPPSQHLVPVGPQHLVLKPANATRAAPFPFDPILILAGANVVWKSIIRLIRGWKKYDGALEDICRAVIEDCWTGDYFAGSAGHFKQFWLRDLAMCTPALIRLGYADRVVQSWAWGLEQFEKAGRLTTTIFPFFSRSYARNVYDYGCDSLPMTLYALREAEADHLIRKHRDLFAKEVKRFYDVMYDPDLGLAKPDAYFSSPRDCITGRSTVFANTMVALLTQILEDLPNLPPPPDGTRGLPQRILEEYWMGHYFRDALDRQVPSGDGNIWPFYFRIFDDILEPEEVHEMQHRAFETLEKRGFTRPLPLRYFEKRHPKSELPFPRFSTPNYEGDNSWMQLGPIYLSLLQGIDPEKFAKHRENIGNHIEAARNYLEVYTKKDQPYKGRFGGILYDCDEGMIWAALFIDVLGAGI